MFDCLRIIFAGTPNFAAHHLNALICTKHKVIGVFTQPDRLGGRGKHLKSSPVKQLAKQYNIPLFQPISFSLIEEKENLIQLNPDIIVVVAYGLILPQDILNIPRLGCINVHGSLLPRWRGAAPIQRAIWKGDNFTGITIIQMDAGLDTGSILNRVVYKIQKDDTSASLYKKLEKIGSDALICTLEQIARNQIIREPQDNTFATYATKLTKEEAKLNWSLSATQLERCVRAFNPWPVSYFYLEKQMIKVWSAGVNKELFLSYKPGTILATKKKEIHVATGKDILILRQLQPQGKKIMSVQDFLNSRRQYFTPGTIIE
ncbi:methionyl-tRNA formyltransferase [secondary endosymbiont of Heteropsylla cubana]|uniref:Methionyl-tRNA formyltransferase n=1 Tax=secondary endosymbiont of Heteropsylla cubana TaxID=134287 RepID=J3TZ58_9ENTR|nr:methionyl-tRNA formyltransferase [secondary endosymbiont of Heteropsylla cubana]AFP85750.1 methionyl-tRNA formyltransferase [secondary endosymbiont of Heteropsylla cubana]